MNLVSHFPHNDWYPILEEQFSADYWKRLEIYLIERENNKATILPPSSDIFKSFILTPFADVKVVILGQDPYHKIGQAMGLSFSVPVGTKLPPSLRNIYKELSEDLKIDNQKSGDLSPWAQQGVMLLNSVLTVEEGQAAAHSKHGWEQFTDEVIKIVSEKKKGIIFVLWGNPAQQKIKLIDQEKHHILLAAHPSPLSAYRGFLGCRHFSKINQLLKQQGLQAIDWTVPPIQN